MIIRILIGAAAGFIANLLAFHIADILLKRREKILSAGKLERRLFPLCMTLAGAAAGAASGLSVMGLYFFLLLVIGGAVSLTDIHFRIIPNDLLLALLAVGILFGIPRMLGQEGFPEFSLTSSLLGMVICFVIFMLPAVMAKKVGAGDVKLAAVMGFTLGLMHSLYAIALMGLLVLAFTFLQRRAPAFRFMKSMIPMGPFIAAAMVAVPVLLEMEKMI